MTRSQPSRRESTTTWTWPAAGIGSRVAACCLDALIVMAAMAVITALAKQTSIARLAPAAGNFLYVVYMILTQAKTGQTLGKKIVGIKVVQAGSLTGQATPSLGRLVIRETVGRCVNILSLGIGYIWIFFDKDRRGFHDKISATKVISLRDSASSAVPLSVLFGGGAAFAIALVAGGYYVLNYTAWPVQQMASRLELAGFKFHGIRGSQKEGYEIDQITFEHSNGTLEVNDLRFKYQPPSGTRREYIVHEVSISSARLAVRALPGLATKDAAPKKAEKIAAKPFGFWGPQLTDIVVESIDLQNIAIEGLEGRSYALKRLLVSNLKVRPSSKSLDLDRFWVESDIIDINIENLGGILPIGGEKLYLALEKPATATIKPALFPDYLRRSIDFKITGSFDHDRPRNAEITAFGGKALFKTHGDDLKLDISNLTLSHYFKTDAPLWDLNLTVAGSYKQLAALRAQGTVGLRSAKFALQGAAFIHAKQNRAYFVMPDFKRLQSVLKGEDGSFILAASNRAPTRDALADLYFGKMPATLLATELAVIDQDARYFAAPQAVPVAAPSETLRAPAAAPVGHR